MWQYTAPIYCVLQTWLIRSSQTKLRSRITLNNLQILQTSMIWSLVMRSDNPYIIQCNKCFLANRCVPGSIENFLHSSSTWQCNSCEEFVSRKSKFELLSLYALIEVNTAVVEVSIYNWVYILRLNPRITRYCV